MFGCLGREVLKIGIGTEIYVTGNMQFLEKEKIWFCFGIVFLTK